MSMSSGGAFYSGSNGQLLLNNANSGMPANSIQDMSVGLDGMLAVATSSGVGRYVNGVWTNFTTAGAVLPSNLAYVVEAGLNKKLYVGYATVGGRGLIVIDSNGVSTTYKTTNSSIANNNVLDAKHLDLKWFEYFQWNHVYELYDAGNAIHCGQVNYGRRVWKSLDWSSRDWFGKIRWDLVHLRYCAFQFEC
jgi:hypothetical protein